MKNRKQTWTYNGIVMRNECRIEDDVCFMELTQGKECLLDVSDMELVCEHRWSAHKEGNSFYVASSAKVKRGKIHRLILDTPCGLDTDHINREGLDNRRCNLRTVTRSQNNLNTVSLKGSSSYLGVSWHNSANKWEAYLWINGNKKHVGLFIVERDAGIARAKEFVKEYGRELNPEQTKLAESELAYA